MSGFFENVIALKTIQTDVTIHCNDHFLEQPFGEDSIWINTMNNKEYSAAEGRRLKCDLNPDKFAYVLSGRFVVLCALTWQETRSRGGFYIGDRRDGDYTGKRIGRMQTGSSVLLHELLHAANHEYDIHGNIRYIGVEASSKPVELSILTSAIVTDQTYFDRG